MREIQGRNCYLTYRVQAVRKLAAYIDQDLGRLRGESQSCLRAFRKTKRDEKEPRASQLTGL